jgi:hypothetical protein
VTAVHVPLDAIGAQARDVRFGRTVLTVITAVLFGLGWLLGRGWLALAWALTAVRVGCQQGCQQAGPSRAARLAEEVGQLRAEVARLSAR